MEQAYDESPPHVPYQAYAPENFRKIIQRQIDTTVNTQIDLIVKASKGRADGRYSNSRPAETVRLRNQFGYPYFIVGSSIVGRLIVAAP